MPYLRISWLTFRNRIREERRYPFQFVLNMLGFVVIASLFAMGSVALLGEGDMGTNMAAFFTAFLAGAAFGLPNDTLGEQRQRLQEVYLRPLPRLAYVTAVSLGRGLEMVLMLTGLTLVVALAGSADLTVVARMAVVAAPIFASMLGLGFVLAGLRLVFQKLGVLSQLLTLVFIGAAMAMPTETLERTATWSPFGAGLLFLRGGELDLIATAVATAAYVAFGFAVFVVSERAMLSRGLLTVE